MRTAASAGRMAGVRRRLAYAVAWTLATAATVGASWLGIRSVLDAAAPHRTTPFSAAELRGAAPTTPTTTPPFVPSAPPPTVAPTSSLSPQPTPTSTPTPGASASPAPSDGWVAVPSGSGGTAYRRVFRVRGGDVTFWVEEPGVRILEAQAAPGFTAVHTRFDQRSLMVSFISSGHISRVYATWRDGPYAEVTESVG